MKKRFVHRAGHGARARQLARIAAGALFGVLLLSWTCVASFLAGDFSRPATLRILYAANACGIVQPCPT